jgi:hypothetical protein
MLAWKVGRVTIIRIVELELPIAYDETAPFMRDARPEALRKLPWLQPHFVDKNGSLLLSVHACWSRRQAFAWLSTLALATTVHVQLQAARLCRRHSLSS